MKTKWVLGNSPWYYNIFHGFFSNHGWIFKIEYSGPINDMTTEAALAAVLLHAPSVTGLDQNPVEVIESGDWVKVDTDKGIIEVTKKE